jgi:hypothetical protein
VSCDSFPTWTACFVDTVCTGSQSVQSLGSDAIRSCRPADAGELDDAGKMHYPFHIRIYARCRGRMAIQAKMLGAFSDLLRLLDCGGGAASAPPRPSCSWSVGYRSSSTPPDRVNDAQGNHSVCWRSCRALFTRFPFPNTTNTDVHCVRQVATFSTPHGCPGRLEAQVRSDHKFSFYPRARPTRPSVARGTRPHSVNGSNISVSCNGLLRRPPQVGDAKGTHVSVRARNPHKHS